METPAPDLLPSKPARFLVMHVYSNNWRNGAQVTFSKVFSAYLWEIGPGSGIFTVPKTATYMFVLSGTLDSSHTTIGLYLKSTSGSTTKENLEQNGSNRGSFNRFFVRQFNAGDKIFLQIESYTGITTGENTPLIFYCTEMM